MKPGIVTPVARAGSFKTGLTWYSLDRSGAPGSVTSMLETTPH